MFKIGQTVIHKRHGVGTINAIESRDFGTGIATKFYIIVIQDNGAPKKVFVPFDATGYLAPMPNRRDVTGNIWIRSIQGN